VSVVGSRGEGQDRLVLKKLTLSAHMYHAPLFVLYNVKTEEVPILIHTCKLGLIIDL